VKTAAKGERLGSTDTRKEQKTKAINNTDENIGSQ
jgi:hypothetical protein